MPVRAHAGQKVSPVSSTSTIHGVPPEGIVRHGSPVSVLAAILRISISNKVAPSTSAANSSIPPSAPTSKTASHMAEGGKICLCGA